MQEINIVLFNVLTQSKRNALIIQGLTNYYYNNTLSTDSITWYHYKIHNIDIYTRLCIQSQYKIGWNASSVGTYPLNVTKSSILIINITN